MESEKLDLSQYSDLSMSVKEYKENKYHNKILSSLINRLKQDLRIRNERIRYLRDPRMLIEVLEDINGVIGNSSIKESLARQIDDIIADTVRVSRNPRVKNRNTMANIMLYGPPGTGKTMLSNKIGKAMYAVGQLNEYDIDETKSFKDKESLEDVNANGVLSFLSIAFFVILILSSVIGVVPQGYKMYAFIAFVIIALVIGIIAMYYLKQSNTKKTTTKSNTNTIKEDRSYVTHATRSHFVGEYVGHSSIKTRKFLQENLGKVIFLDEAYGLIQGYDDKFGNEAANELIQFMSNYPRAIIFIFAGYKKDIENTLFKYQSGFRRRFKYKWNCPGYTPEELFEIFKYHVYNDGWEIKEQDEEEIKRMIIDNADIFKSYAGDIEQVLDFAKIEHSHNYIHGKVEGYSLLTKQHVSKAIEDFRTSADAKESKDEIKKSELDTLLRRVMET